MEEVAQKTPENETINQLSSDIQNLTNKVEALSNSIDAQTTKSALNTQNIEGLHNQLSQLKESTTLLSAKFDIWQNNVESMLANAQTAMQYDNYVLTALAIIIAIFAFVFQKWASKNKKEAIADAIKSIEGTIAQGILPQHSSIRKKLTEAILNSEEFRVAARKANDYINKSEDADKERASQIDISDKDIDLDDVNKANDIDENGNSPPKSDNIKKNEHVRSQKGGKNERYMPSRPFWNLCIRIA